MSVSIAGLRGDSVRNRRSTCSIALLAGLIAPALATGAELQILWPLNRSAYQTNETIDLSVVRSDPSALQAGELTLSLRGDDGSRGLFRFPAPAVAKSGNDAHGTMHLHLNGWLLRPGHYVAEVEADGVKANSEFDVYCHIRKSEFRTINWGRANGKERLLEGEDSLGFNTFYSHGAGDDEAHFIRAGVDFIANCVMSGGHQMDLRSECDWSDPYVARGGTMRVVQRAMIDRQRPNVPGVHFYDEPGLTWEGNPATPHAVSAQARSFESAFGKSPISYRAVDPRKSDDVARWNHWARWKLSFMDAAWKESQFGVSRVRPDFLSLTQSQYGYSAFTDGYYFNVARSLPITSGHGGYHDFGPGYFNPSYFLEMARARDRWKPNWYLPCWYGNTTSDQFRLEQYLSFSTNIQGMMSPPDMEPATNPVGRQGIVETNRLFQKLGPVFDTMPVYRPPVALLFSLSQMIHTQTGDMQANYAHAMPHGVNMPLAYLAGKLIQQQFLPIVEEDVLDGTLADQHRAIVLTSLDYLDPQVISALESFAAGGGLVLLTGDSTVQIKGAVKLPVAPRMPEQEAIDVLMKQQKYNELGPYTTTGKFIAGATPLARAIEAELAKVGIRPIFECNVPTIIATRQQAGDIEYLFAVNATYDEASNGDKNAPKAATATISLVDDGRPVYDAVLGYQLTDFKSLGGKLVGSYAFGPGQMRVFARTTRPIATVRAADPVLVHELVLDKSPLRVDMAASVVDGQSRVVSGSLPLEFHVIDPLGVTRYNLYRTTKMGTCSISLPLAANDPPGEWTVLVRELLSGTEDRTKFQFTPPPRTRSLAGATSRAVTATGDRDNIFRFARLHHDVTIVTGKSAFNESAAVRLTKILEPWGVRCRRMDLDAAAKSRTLTDEEAKTWVGLHYAGKGQIKPGGENAPVFAGFAVQGPVILLGNPDDHPIIKYLLTERFLPYTPDAARFPGVGRGMIAWQLDGVGRGQESLTLIAYDEAGMSEAVGSAYEAVAGIEPLTTYAWPVADSLTPAQTAAGLKREAHMAWQSVLADRVLAMKATPKGISAITHDGSVTMVGANGIVLGSQSAPAAELTAARQLPAPDADLAKTHTRPDRLLKLTARDGNRVAVAYWGGTLRIADANGNIKTEQLLPQDVTSLAWAENKLLAGLADGRIVALNAE